MEKQTNADQEQPLSPKAKRAAMLAQLTESRPKPADLVTPQGGIPTSADTEEPSQASATTARQVESGQMIDPHYLLDNPYQKRVDYEDIEGLADKMRQFGFQGALSARIHPSRPGFYELAFGHRRKRAATLAGVLVRVVVQDLSNEVMILLAISENIDRKDLTPLEEGDSFLELNETLGLSQEAIAAFVGEEKKEKIDRGYVRNRMRVAKLARRYPQVRAFIERHPGGDYLRAIGYLEEEGLGEREINFILERLDQDGWTADNVAAAVKLFKTGGEAAATLLRSRELASLPGPDGHEQSEVTQTTVATEDDRGGQLAENGDAGSTLKRTSQVTDALKRMQRYTKMIGDSAPSSEERTKLSALGELIQLILARS